MFRGSGGWVVDVRRGSKKAKKGGNPVPVTAGVFPYHPEEEFIDKASRVLRVGLTTGRVARPHVPIQERRQKRRRVIWSGTTWSNHPHRNVSIGKSDKRHGSGVSIAERNVTTCMINSILQHSSAQTSSSSQSNSNVVRIQSFPFRPICLISRSRLIWSLGRVGRWNEHLLSIYTLDLAMGCKGRCCR